MEHMQRYFYAAPVADFLVASDDEIFGALAYANKPGLTQEQKSAWKQEFTLLRHALCEYVDAHIFFEFSIPRMGRRADAILLLGDVVVVLEFKVGASKFDAAAIDQVVDYALDLKNFHEGSHNLLVVPVLIATDAPAEALALRPGEQDVFGALKVGASSIGTALKMIKNLSRSSIDAKKWASSSYKPTPTIIEAAQYLYNKHTVEEISRHDAGRTNLSRTSDRIFSIIARAKQEKRKAICLLTGVPGSGKTLAGLNIATRHANTENDERAVYLSGNGPLVEVLREALAQDHVARAKGEGESLKKSEARRKASAFIQNIHHFRDECLTSANPPAERVVIFDEAQRAWNKTQAASFMRRKRDMPDFDQSEPSFLLSAMDRHPEWCVVVCLVGGGQEINTGEAGMVEWIQAIKSDFPHWQVFCSDKIDAPEYNWEENLLAALKDIGFSSEPDLHLGISLRSYRAEGLSAYVSALVAGDKPSALAHKGEIPNYPITVTRSLDCAREWLRRRARGTERYGLVASSNALRLKPEGIHVKAEIDPPLWFLKDKTDVRSSYALEDVATEFHIQGLELDWVGVCWDANFRWSNDKWLIQEFSGTRWQNVHDADQLRYVANAYRVLLTRARQGMVIFVPTGDERDPTRGPSFYDETFQLLVECGAAPL
jgi:hypothetical protein